MAGFRIQESKKKARGSPEFRALAHISYRDLTKPVPYVEYIKWMLASLFHFKDIMRAEFFFE